ncbi:hypothetical protein MPTK1_5g07550 [Marchantia polymorpha subsp. ruderalis]|uniref:Uncharacterized protein n=2 Tax=Marchantia polymorpha TaxID=3197 RepID=A0AAF6BFY3_MARPO|nr:hypothetical protein MARPO_0127s0030 [Marchantia polymorpha]BBN10917.1 hypothetical protein Mp_5g07550 [Marchantia polymorpha subsp. ruderalis]|eukprot:PTQ30247.1 hypothetical protein MARPO_0127s0030 [Marchantia polymorpha]
MESLHSSRSPQSFRLRFELRKGRSKSVRSPRAMGAGGASRDEKNRGLDFEVIRGASFDVIRSSGGKVASLLNLIKQQQHLQLQLQQQLSSSQSHISCKRGQLSFQQIRARRLRSLFALAQHFDDKSAAAGMGHPQSISSQFRRSSEEEGGCQLETKLSRLMINEASQ